VKANSVGNLEIRVELNIFLRMKKNESRKTFNASFDKKSNIGGIQLSTCTPISSAHCSQNLKK